MEKKELIKEKKKEYNRKFRESQKAKKETKKEEVEEEKEEVEEEKEKEEKEDNFFFRKLLVKVQDNALNMIILTIIPHICKTILSKVMCNTLRISNNGQKMESKPPEESMNSQQNYYLPANF